MDLFLSYKTNLKNAIIELSKGMDIIHENICMLRIESKNNFKFYHLSDEFYKKRFDLNLDTLEVDKLFSQFISINKDIKNLRESELDLISKLAQTTKQNLYDDMIEFVNQNNNNLNRSKTGIYILNKNPNDLLYYEVKFIVYSQSSISEKPFILALFKNIKYENYAMKSQQMNTFSNILVSTLTHEINNPLNGLNGQLFVIKSTIQDIKAILNENKDTDLLSKIEGFEISVKYIKYLKDKINIIAKNFVIYSKLKLRLNFNLKFIEINLKYFMEKSLKIFNTLALINRLTVNLDLEALGNYLMRTDLDIFRTLMSNIVLMAEKHCKNIKIDLFLSDLDNNVINTIGNRDKIKFNVIFNEILEYNNSKIDSNGLENLDIINIFTFNNKCLSEYIGLDYNEIYQAKQLKIELVLNKIYCLL